MNLKTTASYLKDRRGELSTKAGAIAFAAGIGGMSDAISRATNDGVDAMSSAAKGDWFSFGMSALALISGLWGMFAAEKPKDG